MKTIGLIVAMLFSVTSWGATPAKIPSLNCGGRIFTDVQNLVQLGCYVNGSTSNCTLRAPGGSSGYQPPALKAFRPICISAISNSAAASSIVLTLSDNDIGHNSSGGAFTGPQYYHGDSAANTFSLPVGPSLTNSGPEVIGQPLEGSGFRLTNTSTDFIGCDFTSGTTVSRTCWVWGVEEDE